MTKPVVLLTDPVSPSVREALEGFAEVVEAAPSAPGEFSPAIGRAHAVIVRSQLPGDVFDAAPDMLVAVRHGAGVDMIPIENASANGVAVSAVPGANNTAVAEFGVAQMIAFSRRLPAIETELRTNGWAAARKMTSKASEIGGKTVGIIGMGSVGVRLAEICSEGFGMEVWGYRRDLSKVPEFVRPAQMSDIFANADFVVIACPLTEETRGMVDEGLLNSMQRTSVFVNLARGPVVDQEALCAALREGRIAGAILDVFDPEPLPTDHELLRLPNVLATPHCSGISRESAVKLGMGAVEEIRRVLSGTPPKTFFNPDCWDRIAERVADRNVMAHGDA